MESRSVQIVTFNANEASAVNGFISQLVAAQDSIWRFDGPFVALAQGTPKQSIRHVPLSAQGNTMAAGQVARFFSDSKPQDFVIFYGCAGAINPANVGSAFLVKGSYYASLGTVEMKGGRENVTLKNKWIVDTGTNQTPLDALELPRASSDDSLNLPIRTGISTAHVIATDKVVRVTPTIAPTPISTTLPHARYAKAEWTYAQSLAYFASSHSGDLLVEMESFGICTIAHALGIADQTLILRIATDDLVNHATSDKQQFDLLWAGRTALARLVLAVLRPGVTLP